MGVEGSKVGNSFTFGNIKRGPVSYYPMGLLEAGLEDDSRIPKGGSITFKVVKVIVRTHNKQRKKIIETTEMIILHPAHSQRLKGGGPAAVHPDPALQDVIRFVVQRATTSLFVEASLMPIPVICSCTARLRVGDHLRGQQIQCPKCGSIHVISNSGTASEGKAPTSNGTLARPAPKLADLMETSAFSPAERERLEEKLEKGEELL